MIIERLRVTEKLEEKKKRKRNTATMSSDAPPYGVSSETRLLKQPPATMGALSLSSCDPHEQGPVLIVLW